MRLTERREIGVLVDRRKFLSRATVGIGVAIGVAWAVPGAAYVLSPARKKSGNAEWIPLGAADKVEVGIPSLFKAKVVKTSGWVSSCLLYTSPSPRDL